MSEKNALLFIYQVSQVALRELTVQGESLSGTHAKEACGAALHCLFPLF